MVPFPFLDFRGKVGGKAGGSSQRTNRQRREEYVEVEHYESFIFKASRTRVDPLGKQEKKKKKDILPPSFLFFSLLIEWIFVVILFVCCCFVVCFLL